jgi:hypothetical protein
VTGLSKTNKQNKFMSFELETIKENMIPKIAEAIPIKIHPIVMVDAVVRLVGAKTFNSVEP